MRLGFHCCRCCLGCVQTDATTSNIVAPTMLGVVGACWKWCANGCNNSQQCWDLQWIVGRIQPISDCKPCVMSVRGPNNVGRVVQTDPTLLRYALAIMEQKKCWELLSEKFDRFQTLCNNKQQHPTTCNRVYKRTQHVTSNNVGSFGQQLCVRLHGDLNSPMSSKTPHRYLILLNNP